MSADLALTADQARARLRQVHRAASELRRGVPVVVDGQSPLLVLAAETAGGDALAELEALSGVRPVLVLAPARAAAILRIPMSADGGAVAVALPDSLYRIEVYQSLADPTAAQPSVRHVLQTVPTPALADAAIALIKIGRLLPALIAVPLAHGTAAHGLVAVPASDVTRVRRERGNRTTSDRLG